MYRKHIINHILSTTTKVQNSQCTYHIDFAKCFINPLLHCSESSVRIVHNICLHSLVAMIHIVSMQRKMADCNFTLSTLTVAFFTSMKKCLQKKTFKCNQCDNDFKSENGLKMHIGSALLQATMKKHVRQMVSRLGAMAED